VELANQIGWSGSNGGTGRWPTHLEEMVQRGAESWTSPIRRCAARLRPSTLRQYKITEIENWM